MNKNWDLNDGIWIQVDEFNTIEEKKTAKEIRFIGVFERKCIWASRMPLDHISLDWSNPSEMKWSKSFWCTYLASNTREDWLVDPPNFWLRESGFLFLPLALPTLDGSLLPSHHGCHESFHLNSLGGLRRGMGTTQSCIKMRGTSPNSRWRRRATSRSEMAAAVLSLYCAKSGWECKVNPRLSRG